ncbi:MAG: hypothetical protein WCX46_00575 [Candidatus Paceibacterota bacterium]
MKKIIMFLSLGFLLVGGQSALAAGIWNGASNDCKSLTIATIATDGVTTNGINNPCWQTSPTINAQPGEWVNVRIYYHNSSDMTNAPGVTATNTRVYLSNSNPSSTVASTSHSFTGKITSDQGSLNLGSVTVYTTSPQTLTFVSANWAPDQTYNYTQYGSSIMNSGGQILGNGTILPGWDHQGSVVVSFKVGSNQSAQNCTISNFSASDTNLNQGESSVLSWSTNNCTHVSISNLNSTGLSGSQNVYPNSTTTYVLNASGVYGSDTESVTISVNNIQQNTTGTLTSASSCYIDEGDDSCDIDFNWHTYNPVNSSSSVTQDGNGTVATGLSGSDSFDVEYGSETFRLYHNGNQLASRNVHAYCSSGTSWNGDECEDNNNNNDDDCYITNFSSNTNNVTLGQSATLSWHTENCSSANISNVGSVNSHSGSKIVYPNYNNNYYVLNVHGSNGNDSRSISISINGAQNTSGTLTSSVDSCFIASGNNSCNIVFHWNTVNPATGATSAVTKDNSGTVGVGNSGTSSFSVPYKTATFRLYNNSNQLAAKTVYASCTSGTFWNGNYCAVPVAPVAPIYNTTYVPPTNTTIVRNNTTVIGAASPIMLKIENHYTNIRIGDVIEYIVTYKNIGKVTLKDPMVQIILPEGITFTNSSRGIYSAYAHTLSVPLEDLKSGASGIIYLQGRVNSKIDENRQIVTNAVLVYTNTNGAQENAIAYVLNDVIDGGNSLSLGAAAILSGFYSLGLLGLLFLLLIILLIVYITRRSINRRKLN